MWNDELERLWWKQELARRVPCMVEHVYAENGRRTVRYGQIKYYPTFSGSLGLLCVFGLTGMAVGEANDEMGWGRYYIKMAKRVPRPQEITKRLATPIDRNYVTDDGWASGWGTPLGLSGGEGGWNSWDSKVFRSTRYAILFLTIIIMKKCVKI